MSRTIKEWVNEKREIGRNINLSKTTFEEVTHRQRLDRETKALKSVLVHFSDVKTTVDSWVCGGLAALLKAGPNKLDSILEGTIMAVIDMVLKTKDDPMWNDVLALIKSVEEHGVGEGESH